MEGRETRRRMTIERKRQTKFLQRTEHWNQFVKERDDLHEHLQTMGENAVEARNAAHDATCFKHPYRAVLEGEKIAGPDKADDPENEEGAPNLSKTTREVLDFVTSNCGKRALTRVDCPNPQAWELVKWMRKTSANESEVWKKFLAVATQKDAAKIEAMKDDGQEHLKMVTGQINEFAATYPELYGKQHAAFTETMYEAAGKIVSGGEKREMVGAA